MCLEILTQGRSPLLSVKISLFDVFKQLLTLHKLTPISDATSYGDLCKHLGIDSSTDLDDRYSNLSLNAYTNRHVHAENLK